MEISHADQNGYTVECVNFRNPAACAFGGGRGRSGRRDVANEGNDGEAAPLESGFGLTESALISVVVTSQNSRPATNFGSDVGNGSGVITLPSGWSLTSDFNLPAGGCAMIPTQFDNVGSGVYTIRVAADAACPWVASEYHYAVGLNKDVKKGRDKINFRSTTLGSLVMP